MSNKERQFGILVAAILSIVSIWLIVRDSDRYVYTLIIGSIFLLLSLFFPILLRPVLRAWLFFGYILGWINTKILLTFIFLFILTPIALLMKVFRVNKKNKKSNDQDSYWIARTEQSTSGSMEKQY